MSRRQRLGRAGGDGQEGGLCRAVRGLCVGCVWACDDET